MKRINTLSIVSFLGLLFAASTCFAQMYTVTDLGTLGGSWSQANGINNYGQVVGTSEFLGSVFGSSHAFRTAPNSPINPTTDDLTTVPCTNPGREGGRDVCFALALGVNDSGQVVGSARDMPDNDPHPFRTAANRPIANPDDVILPVNSAGFFEGVALGINNSGQVVGWGDCCPSWGGTGAFRTDANSPLTANNIGTGVAYGINDSGQVVGDTSANGGSRHAFRTAPNQAINPATDDLGTLGGSFSSGTTINNFGQVVGWSSLAGDTVQHAFLYDGGVMHDLNNLIPAGSNCALAGAQYPASPGESPDINDAGQIAANVSCNGQPHAVLLIPIYKAFVQPPINADGSSIFKVKSGVVPVKFTLRQSDVQTCNLPAATIALTRATSDALASVDESIYSMQADSGSSFRNDGCRYVYNLAASALGVGMYRVDISINGIFVGHTVFALK